MRADLDLEAGRGREPDDLDLEIRRAAERGRQEQDWSRLRARAALQGSPDRSQPSDRLLVLLCLVLLGSTTLALMTLRAPIAHRLGASADGDYVTGEVSAVVQDIDLFAETRARLPRSLVELDYTTEEMAVVEYERRDGEREYIVTLTEARRVEFHSDRRGELPREPLGALATSRREDR